MTDSTPTTAAAGTPCWLHGQAVYHTVPGSCASVVPTTAVPTANGDLPTTECDKHRDDSEFAHREPTAAWIVTADGLRVGGPFDDHEDAEGFAAAWNSAYPPPEHTDFVVEQITAEEPPMARYDARIAGVPADQRHKCCVTACTAETTPGWLACRDCYLRLPRTVRHTLRIAFTQRTRRPDLYAEAVTIAIRLINAAADGVVA